MVAGNGTVLLVGILACPRVDVRRVTTAESLDQLSPDTSALTI
jgi:hypothetical protein